MCEACSASSIESRMVRNEDTSWVTESILQVRRNGLAADRVPQLSRPIVARETRDEHLRGLEIRIGSPRDRIAGAGLYVVVAEHSNCRLDSPLDDRAETPVLLRAGERGVLVDFLQVRVDGLQQDPVVAGEPARPCADIGQHLAPLRSGELRAEIECLGGAHILSCS